MRREDWFPYKRIPLRRIRREKIVPRPKPASPFLGALLAAMIALSVVKALWDDKEDE